MLDTNMASAALAGHHAADARLRDLPNSAWAISSIVRAELRFGIARKPEAVRLARLVEAFLQVAPTEAFDAAAADAYGRVRAQLEKEGKGIGVANELIAAHALALGAVVVTHNRRHFDRVAGLQVEDWLELE